MVVIEIQYFTSLCKIPLRSLRLLRDLRGYLPQPDKLLVVVSPQPPSCISFLPLNSLELGSPKGKLSALSVPATATSVVNLPQSCSLQRLQLHYLLRQRFPLQLYAAQF